MMKTTVKNTSYVTTASTIFIVLKYSYVTRSIFNLHEVIHNEFHILVLVNIIIIIVFVIIVI